MMKDQDPSLIPIVDMQAPRAKVPYDNPNLRVVSPFHDHRHHRRLSTQNRVGQDDSHISRSATESERWNDMVDAADQSLENRNIHSPSKYTRRQSMQGIDAVKSHKGRSRITSAREYDDSDENYHYDTSTDSVTSDTILKCSPAKTSIVDSGDDQVNVHI